MTAHQDRQAYLRKRLVKVIAHLPEPEKRAGGKTRYNDFAGMMAEIAKREGYWPWNTTVLAKNGSPKDLASTLKRFAEGKSGLVSRNLQLVELACIHYESMARRIRQEEGLHKHAKPWVPEVLEGGLVKPDEEAQLESIQQDPEILALYTIKDALDALDQEARKRVLMWAADKFGLEFLTVKHA